VIDLGGPLVWNVKVHRVGGLSEVARIVALARQAGALLWAGTMPESGLGSQAALAAAGMPEFVYPSDLEPSSRWFGAGKDVIELTMSGDGRMAVPRQPIERLLVPGRLAEASTPLLDLRPPPR
jgi:o-succinylbenzoate synthase